MKNITFKLIQRKFYALILLLLCHFSFGQTTIVSEGLNNSSTLFTLSGGAYFTGNSASGDRPASSPFASEGTHARGVSSGTATLTSSSINTSSYTDVSLSFRLASFSIGSTNNGADGTDIVTVAVSPDGGTTYYNTLRVIGNTNAQWTYSTGTGTASTLYDGNTSSVDFTPANGGNRTTDGYSTVVITDLPEVTDLRIRITMLNNATGERWLVDDFVVEGTLAPAGPTVTTTSNSGLEGTVEAYLTGTINANGTTTDASFEYGTTVAYGETATATPSPVTGTTTTDIEAYVSSLTLNTLYDYRAVGTQSAVPTYGDDLTFYTLAAAPGVLVVSNPMQTTLDVTVNATTENSNPASTEYAIQEAGGQYVQANGTLGATAVWQTAAVWSTTTVTGLNFSTSYSFSAKARNGAAVETGFGTSASETTLAAQAVDYAVIQSPTTTQNVLEGGSLPVYIKAYEPGLTTLSGEQSNLFGWVGYSSTNDNPSNPGWTWVPASFNVEIGNDDEYVATLSGLAIGTYYYAGRFQIGTGSYVYAGSAGVWNNDNVTLNINADVVNFANIQSPTSGTITEGTSNFNVYAQVYEPGVTEAAGQGAGISAWIGYSSADSNPNGNDWTWVAATFNVQFGNNDEYVANIASGLTPGTYYYASRFLKTGSSTYVYGGTNGNWNDDNGVLTIEGLETPVATAATAIAQTQFNANWGAVAGASSYEVDVYTRETGTEITEDFGFEGTTSFPSGWSGTGYVQNAVANSNTGTYFAGLNLATKNIRTDLISNPTSLSFYYRYSGSSANNTVVVQVSQDGSTWDNYETYVATGSGASTTYNVSNVALNLTGDYYIQWIMTARTGGSFYLDDVRIVSGTPEVITPVSGSPFTTTATTLPITGLDAQTTYYYVVRAINGSVETVNSNEIDVETKPTVVTWNGTAWSNIDGPDETIDAIIAGVYATGTHEEFTAKKVNVTTGTLTVNTGDTITVVDVLENESDPTAVVVENNANLIQSNDVDNIGSITVERNSSDVMRLDYTLWSSPVAGQNLLGFSPQTMTNRFYVYNPSNNQYATITPSTNSFAEGTGYLIRSPDNHSTTAADWAGTFVGEPHNGDVTISVSNDTYNAVGNPYPSTISANAFITANGLTEALYFWRKTNGAAGSAYATYTFAGGAGTGSSDSDTQVPNGTIQVGQGFIAKATSGSLVFTNLMRTANHQNQFFRNADSDRNRIWLNVSNTQNVVGQTLLAYMENTSVEYDAMYDGKYINDSQTAFTSLLNNEEYAVQARGLFSAVDVVPMHFKTEAQGIYTISIANVDGLFETEQDIFVKDNFTGVEHNLKNTAYEFTSVEGSFGDRFEIIYQSTLSVSIPEFANQTIVFAKDNRLNVQSGSVNITGIQVFDVQGRLVLDVKEINSVMYSTSLDQISNGVLLVKVTAENGQSTTKKIIK